MKKTHKLAVKGIVDWCSWISIGRDTLKRHKKEKDIYVYENAA